MTEPSAKLSSEARVATLLPRRYLSQLCKHFEHRLPVTLAERQGRIEFASGLCELETSEDDTALILRVTGADEAAVAGLQDVVARHLVRFAFREPPDIQWTPAARDGSQAGERG